MCGINGFNWKDDYLIRRMDEAIQHRGPDATAFFVDDSVSLGHNRLSIIDLSDQAGQPMRSADGRYVIVYNGEIYNFQELKAEIGKSYAWKTHGDTEVIIAAYQKWGVACVDKFNGIFAFAIWDTQCKELFLARDHNGIKPLYYHHSGTGINSRFIFSSEIKAILEHPISRTLCRESLSHYLRILYVPEPFTMFDGIMKLPAAHYAILKDGKLSIVQYWQVSNDDRTYKSKKKYEQMLRNNMEASIKRQLISDRPLGIFLSGGLDSTIVLYHVSKLRDNVDTYSVGFNLSSDEQEDKFNQDFDLARRTAKYYHTRHHELRLSVDDVVQNLEKAVWHLDEPIANPTIVAQYVLSQFSKKTVDVILGGDGGDELFGGYDRYRYSLIASYYQSLPLFIRAIGDFFGILRKLNVSPGVVRYAQFLFQKDKVVQEVASGFNDNKTLDFFKKKFSFDENVNREGSFEQIFMDVDRRSWLTDEALVRTDKMTMSAGIEARVPFLDKEMVMFAFGVPLCYKISLFCTKILIRDAYKDLIPDFIRRQPKRGWFSPGAKWLRNEKIYQFASEMLNPGYYPETSSLFDWSGVKKMLDDHKDSKRYNSVMLWALIIFQIWAKRYNVKV